MKSVVALEEFQKIIQRDPANISFCESELSWIENRKTDWSSDRIRVGVIGVTSSGKSTLINAILGTDILSSAIAPSSGQLVCCSYGEKSEIIIHFEDGTEQKLSGKKYKRDILQQYSDERYNAKNEKGVLSIELTSVGLAFVLACNSASEISPVLLMSLFLFLLSMLVVPVDELNVPSTTGDNNAFSESVSKLYSIFTGLVEIGMLECKIGLASLYGVLEVNAPELSSV